jgi:hypothetical protein
MPRPTPRVRTTRRRPNRPPLDARSSRPRWASASWRRQPLRQFSLTVRWGDYSAVPVGSGPSSVEAGQTGDSAMPAGDWQRTPREARVELTLPDRALATGEVDVPESRGLRVAWAVRSVPPEAVGVGLPPDTRCVSFFLVNRRDMQPDEIRDTAFAFQTELEIHSRCRWCRGPTCAAWTAPSGRNASPTCSTAMRSNSPWDTAWRPKRKSRTEDAIRSEPAGFPRPTSNAWRRRKSKASSSGWTSWGAWPMVTRRNRNSAPWSAAIASGSRISGQLSVGSCQWMRIRAPWDGRFRGPTIPRGGGWRRRGSC